MSSLPDGSLTRLGVLLAALCCAAPGFCQSAKRQDVEAVFLLDFAKFVEWPSGAFPSSESPLVIGVLGADPFGRTLDEAVTGETVGGRPVVVKRFGRLDELQPCHVLYISASEKARLPAIFQRLDDASVLTVGEMDRFTATGGIINFRMRGARVRFEINRRAAARAGLKINAQLLMVAQADGA